MADKIKLLLAVLVLAAGIGGFYYYADQTTLVRVIGLLVAGGLAIAIALQTQPGRKAWEFLLESRNEIRKVVWPTRKETMQTTLIVIIVVIIVAAFLWGLDSILLWAVRSLTT